MDFIHSLILMVMGVVYAQGDSLDLYGEACTANLVTLGCVLDSFTSSLTWSRMDLAPVTCVQFGCGRPIANISGNIYSLSANASGSYIVFNMTEDDYEIKWTCNYNSTDLTYTVKEMCGQTLSTRLTPTSDVGRSSLVVSTDGGIISLNTLSNSPDETMTFNLIFSAITETSFLLFQTSASLYTSPYYISKTYIPNYPMSTLTTNIFGNSISLLLSSSGTFFSHYSERSIVDTRTSDLSLFSSNGDLHSPFSTQDVLESSNFNSLSKIYHVDSITSMGLVIGNMISSFVNSSHKSDLKSMASLSLSDSLTQDLRSQITISSYGIVSTQKETGSPIDHTPLTLFTYTGNLQSSLEISYQPSVSPSFATYLTGISTQSLLCNRSIQSEECQTIQTTLSKLNTNSKLPTTFTSHMHETSKSYSSSKYNTSVGLKGSFDFDSKTENSTIRTRTSKIIETMPFHSIAESHETKSSNISMNYDYSSNLLINSPITSFGSTSGTLIVRPTMVEGHTSMYSLFKTFEDKSNTLSVNSLRRRSLSESETVGITMKTSVETSNENTLFGSSWIAPSISFSCVHESVSLHYGLGSDSVYKATSSANSVLFDSFSSLPEKDSNNVLSTTSNVVWAGDISRGSLSRIVSSFYDSTAYISTKYMLSISVNSDRYSSATNTNLSQPKDFVSTMLPSASKYFYSSDINTASSSLLVSSSVKEHSVITYSPSLTKSSKVIAISVTVVGCILFVAITILVLFGLKLLQCKPRSKVSKTIKKFTNADSNRLSISTGGRRGTSLFDKPYGLPTRYYDKTATSWGVNDNQFTCTYNKNWDDIT